jgi:cytoskeleton protein RodZ
MSTVAEQLNVAREAQGITVQQVADATKIRTDHIYALENGEFSVFSAPIYIRGSVKIYAKFLKLDLPPLMAALNAELGRTEKFSEPPPFTDEPKKPLDRVIYLLAKLNIKVVLAVVAVLGIAVVAVTVNAVLNHQKNNDPLANLPPARYEPASPGDTLPLPKK